MGDINCGSCQLHKKDNNYKNHSQGNKGNQNWKNSDITDDELYCYPKPAELLMPRLYD